MLGLSPDSGPRIYRRRQAFKSRSIMPSPSNGDYVIYNRALGHTGDKLAITHNGKDQYATVEPLDRSSKQIWTLQKSGSTTFSVSPNKQTNLQAAWGENAVKVQSAGSYVWSFKDEGYGYFIQDGGLSQNWGIESASPGTKVTIGKDNGQPSYRWILEKV